MKQITFVCTGNVCRSAVAEAILKQKIKLNHITDVTVNSVGTMNLCGAARDGIMARIAAGYGYNMDGVSTFRTKEILEKADLILVMTHTHKLEVQNIIPYEYWGRIRLFMDYCFDKEIPLEDPTYMPESVYLRTFQIIEKGCQFITERLKAGLDDTPWDV